MADLLINIDDIKQYRAVSLDQKRCDPFIVEVQENDLRPVLNDALYRDFTEKVFSTGDPMYANYQTLLNGGSYLINGVTINYPGIKPMLCYFALSRIVMNNQINVTMYGVVQKNIDQSSPVEAGALKLMVTELRSVALSYQSRLEMFLQNNIATYPLYNSMAINQSTRTGLNFFCG